MKLPRRNFLHLAAGAAALPVLSRLASAQVYPTRPVHWIVSFAAGGANDIVARIVGQYLSDHLGQQFIIENRSGAGGNVGMQSVLSFCTRWLHDRLRRSELRHQPDALREASVQFHS